MFNFVGKSENFKLDPLRHREPVLGAQNRSEEITLFLLNEIWFKGSMYFFLTQNTMFTDLH